MFHHSRLVPTLYIETYEQFSDSFIDSFHSMRSIQKVILLQIEIFNKHTKNWYFGKSVSEVMLSPNGMNVKHINNNCGFISYIMTSEFKCHHKALA